MLYYFRSSAKLEIHTADCGKIKNCAADPAAQ